MVSQVAADLTKVEAFVENHQRNNVLEMKCDEYDSEHNEGACDGPSQLQLAWLPNKGQRRAGRR